MDEKIKTWPRHFFAKENPNMEKALFLILFDFVFDPVTVWCQSKALVDF